jgi:hypothetical protein
MANWKKVVVSGSAAEFLTVKVDNLASGVVTGSGSTLGTQAINGTGNILATTGATGISASGSFSGSFHGDGTNLTGVVASAPNSLSGGTGLTSFSYNGSTAVTASVSGAASLSTNNLTKWTGTAFANSSLTDNGTNITGTTSIQLTGASSILSGSFSGSFAGLADRAVSASYANKASTADSATTATTANTASKVDIQTVSSASDTYAITFVGPNSFTGTQQLYTTASGLSFDPAGGGNLTVKNIFGTASLANTASYVVTANTASYVAGNNVVGTVASATTASYANNAGAGNGAFSGSFSGSFQGDGSNLTGIAATLFVSGGTGNGQVDLKTQTLSIVGTANEVNTSVAGQTVTVGLPDSVTIVATLTAGTASIQENLLVQGNTTLQGDLTVNGTTTFINTQNLYIEDKFALFASGSTTAVDGGFVIQSAAAGTGYAFGYDASADRWALEDNVSGSATAFSGTPTAYIASVQYGTSGSLPANPSYGGSAAGYGNIWVSTDTSDIWIYA